MSRSVLIRDRITPQLKQALQLPQDTWQLVINQAQTAASYMDGKHTVHHVEIDEVKRGRLRTAMRSHALLDA